MFSKIKSDVQLQINELELQLIIERAELAGDERKHDALWDEIKRVLSVDDDFTRWLKGAEKRLEWLQEEHRVVSRRIWRLNDTIRRVEAELVILNNRLAQIEQEEAQDVKRTELISA